MEAVCSTDEGLCTLKPDPEGLIKVTRRLGLPKKYCVFIGDRDDTDGETARKAGMPFLLRKSNPRQPNEFSDYYKLLEDFSRAMSDHETIP
jgi:FMN phosphatase YigB (HAD superfamily)